MKRKVVGCLLLVASCCCLADDWDARRTAAVNRSRGFVYNTDGCDALYWPNNLPATVENFTSRRLVEALGTRITTISYCPQSAGFGHFICQKAGEPLTGTVPHPNGNRHNATAEFFKIGTDPLKIATEFCATNNLEVFVSIRMNDQHDASSVPGNLSALYPQFKLDHPECLMGGLDPQDRVHLYQGYAGWSCVNFDCELVRERMKKFVRELVTNYDVDGIEYDFNRHFMLFKSVATGGHASPEEVAKMTQLMRDLKAITEEVGRAKNRPIVIAVRMPDSLEYDLAVGADLETWMKEKLLDIWIGGGYFLLNPLKQSADIAHRHGIKFYLSHDESRIPGYTKTNKINSLPGRQTPAFYAARIAASQEAGCDGVYVFNLENDGLRTVAGIDPKKSAKYYYAIERGCGGYEPWHWLKDGRRYSNLPKLDPGYPLHIKSGATCAFEMYFGNDFEDGAKVTAQALSNIPDATLALKVNGRAFKMTRDGDGYFATLLPTDVMKRGSNAFVVTFPADVPANATFNDFCVRVIPRGVPDVPSSWMP